jgi:hypothetical protein
MTRMKHVIIPIGLLLFFVALPIHAQDDQTPLYGGPPDLEEMLMQQGGISGIGVTVIDGDPFFRAQLQPDIDLGKIGLGLDIVLLYNPEAKEGEDTILAEDGEKWDNISTFLRIVRYVRYGRLNEPVYARFGELDYVTIGHGFIMSGYANYDRRGLRVNLHEKKRRVGIETIVNNIGDPTIFGGRVFARPLRREGAPPILNRLEFGGSYLTDINPLPSKDDEDPLIALGVDVGLPIFENRLLSLMLYDDLAFLNTKPKADATGGTETATGNAVGLGLSISKALFKVEYRTFGEGFRPTVFDYTYESIKGRAAAAATPDFAGIDLTKTDEARRGYFSMMAVRPIPKVHFMATFEDYTNSEPKLYAGVTESGLIGGLSFRAFYTKRDIGLPYADPTPGNPNHVTDPGFFEDLVRLDERSAFTVRLGYEVFPRFEVALLREYRFRRIETADGETGYEPIQKTSFEAGLRLDF